MRAFTRTNFPPALVSCRKVCTDYPDTAAYGDAQFTIGLVFQEQGKYDEAIAEYSEIVRQSPNYVPARLNLGLCLYAAGRRTEGAEQWQAVLRISPGNRSAEMYLQFAGLHPEGPRKAASK